MRTWSDRIPRVGGRATVAGLIALALALGAVIARSPASALERGIGPDAIAVERQAAAWEQERYNAFYWEHTREVYEWQHTSSVIIFLISMALVTSGFVLAFLQFRQAGALESRTHHAARRGAAAPEAPDGADGVAPDEFKLASSAFSVSFKTRSIATLVLIISMGYYALYIFEVYPITSSTTSPALGVSSVSEPYAASDDLPITEEMVRSAAEYTDLAGGRAGDGAGGDPPPEFSLTAPEGP